VKRCFITGASGFVGANLVRRLLADGHQAHVALRPGHQPWRLQEIASSLQVHSVDIANADQVRQAIQQLRPEWVFHLAAYGAYSSQTGLARMVDVNVKGTAALLDACSETGVEAFVHTGSSSEYGYKDHAPHEDEVLEPNSPYAITKAAATHYCQFAARTTGINAIAVRLYSIYGPYEEPARLIPTLVAHGLRGLLPPLVSPATARDFVYVDDAVDALVQIAQKARTPGVIYNLCSGIQTTMATVVATARQLMGIAVEPVWSTMQQRSWDTDIWIGSPEKLARAIGWRTTISFEAGLQKTIDWSRKRQAGGV
jgi:UDP-glucose 4-epimerase